MIRLFIKFSLSMILMGLACRWTFYRLMEGQVYTDRERVISGMTDVQIGGLRVLASELANAGDEPTRQQRWEAIKQEFRSPLEIRPLNELTDAERRQLSSPNGFIHSYRNEIIDTLGVPLDAEHYLRLGPIASKIGEVVEEQSLEWLRIMARKMETSSDVDGLLETVSRESRVPVRLRSRESIPVEARQRLESGVPTAFYGLENEYYVVMPLENREDLLCLGPLPKVRELARKTLNTALGLCFACIVGTSGWLVYSVAAKFRRIEVAAKRIAEGRFDARVDEVKAGESKMLASAFNLMASKTETSIRAKNELLQVVSHELRTPLSRLRFAVELLDVSKYEEHKRARMMILRQSIDNLDAIVDEVLDYVRNEDSEPAKAREWIEIERSVEPMIAVYKLEHPKLRFEWVSSAYPQTTDVYAERVSFHRVVGNLLSNAVRYARSTVRIHVSLYDEPHGAEQAEGTPTNALCVEVEDDGPGIPKEKRREILAPFVRLSPEETLSNINAVQQQSEETAQELDADSEDTNSHAGLGLGLAIVERILKQHGGSVCIEEGELGGCLVRTFWPIPRDSVLPK